MPNVVATEYYRRRPLRVREMLAAVSVGVMAGAFVYYAARVAIGRSRIVIGGEELARTPSRPQHRRARNG